MFVLNFLNERVVNLQAFSLEKMQEENALIIAVFCISRGKKEKKRKKEGKERERKGKGKKREEMQNTAILSDRPIIPAFFQGREPVA